MSNVQDLAIPVKENDHPTTSWYRAMPARMMTMNLSGADFRVMMVIDSYARFQKNGRGCYAAPEALARRTKLHPKTVAKSIRKLTQKGLLYVRHNGPYCEYFIDYRGDGGQDMPEPNGSTAGADRLHGGSQTTPHKEQKKEQGQRTPLNGPASPDRFSDEDSFHRERLNALRRKARADGLSKSAIQGCVETGRWYEAQPDIPGCWQQHAACALEDLGVKLPETPDEPNIVPLYPAAETGFGLQDDGGTE